MPKLQRAKTVACGLLRWDRCCIIVVSHWSKPAGQNMASLLVVVGFRTSHSMPKEESHVIFSKNLPLKGDHFRVYLVNLFEGWTCTRAGDPAAGRVLLEQALAFAEQLGTVFVVALGRACFGACRV